MFPHPATAPRKAEITIGVRVVNLGPVAAEFGPWLPAPVEAAGATGALFIFPGLAGGRLALAGAATEALALGFFGAGVLDLAVTIWTGSLKQLRFYSELRAVQCEGYYGVPEPTGAGQCLFIPVLIPMASANGSQLILAKFQ